MNSITCRAFAKINLTLDVGARRPDGYHDIRSIMQTIALHDTLTVTLTPDVPGVRLEVTGAEAEGVPVDETNLVYRAASLLTGERYGLHFHLQKRIPAQAGLGGGSSNAAAALQAVNDLLELNFSLARLAEIGASLGADVPFFLTGGTALAEGVGERITPLRPLLPPWPLVIVKPPIGVSTAAAYAALDASPRSLRTATDAWLRGEHWLSNDFETMVLRGFPPIASAHAALSLTDGTGESFRAMLCGSGAAVFCRVPTAESAHRLADRMRSAGWAKVWVTETQGAEK